jgi:hypothetical protein
LGQFKLFFLGFDFGTLSSLGLFEGEAGCFESLASENDFVLLPLFGLLPLRLDEAELLFEDGGVELEQPLTSGDDLAFADEDFFDRCADEGAGDEDGAALGFEGAEGVDGLFVGR